MSTLSQLKGIRSLIIMAIFILLSVWTMDVNTQEREDVLSQANYATTDEELEKWGRKLSQVIRDSMINTVLWANHTAFALGPRIKSWTPTIGTAPGVDFETIEINR